MANASEDASLQLPKLAASQTYSEESQATEAAGSLPLSSVENTTKAHIASILRQALQEIEPAPSDKASIGTSAPAGQQLPLANQMDSVNTALASYPTAGGANPVALSSRSEVHFLPQLRKVLLTSLQRRAAEHREQVRRAKAYRAAVAVQRPNALVRTRAATEDVLKPHWGKPIEEILGERAAAAASARGTGGSLKRDRTIDGAATDNDDNDNDEVRLRCRVFILVLIFV